MIREQGKCGTNERERSKRGRMGTGALNKPWAVKEKPNTLLVPHQWLKLPAGAHVMGGDSETLKVQKQARGSQLHQPWGLNGDHDTQVHMQPFSYKSRGARNFCEEAAPLNGTERLLRSTGHILWQGGHAGSLRTTKIGQEEHTHTHAISWSRERLPAQTPTCCSPLPLSVL
jgi:hypothetical protein